MARISAMVQVGRKHRAGKPEKLSGNIIIAPIYGKVQNHWGMIARADAWYELDHVRVENGSIDDLRAEARKRIDELNATHDTIYAVRSTQQYARYYENSPETGERLSK